MAVNPPPPRTCWSGTVPGGKYSTAVVVGVVWSSVGDVVIALPTSQTCLYLVNYIQYNNSLNYVEHVVMCFVPCI